MKVRYIHNPGKRFVDYLKFIQHNFQDFINEPEPDILLVCGGDGAMLRATFYNSHL